MFQQTKQTLCNSSSATVLFVCLFVCLLLNGTSALFRPLVPRIVEMEHTNHVKNDLNRKVILKNKTKLN